MDRIFLGRFTGRPEKKVLQNDAKRRRNVKRTAGEIPGNPSSLTVFIGGFAMNGQLIIDRYMEELNAELANMPDVERENAIDELKGHITAFVQDRIKAGLSEEELQEAVESEFSHPKELAELMMGDGGETKRRRSLLGKSWISVLLIVTIIALPLLPSDFRHLPLAVYLMVLAGYVWKRKKLVMFAGVRKNKMRSQKEIVKISRVGAVYLLFLAVVLLLSPFLNALVVLLLIAVSCAAFFLFLNIK
ncbi:YitQ [Bacillus subtilis QB928]|nr:YitQ [Bacillus subtilis QB928]CAA70626.1 YitQ [Bacillus subtilis]